MKIICHTEPWIEKSDKEEVIKYLNQEYVGYLDNLEKELTRMLKEFIYKRNIRTVTSGTTALLIILSYLKNKLYNKEIILSSINCWSVYNTVKMMEAKPVICDTRAINDFRSDYVSIREKITGKTAVIIITHMYGIMVEDAIINKLKKEFPSIIIIEDYSTSFGSLNCENKIGKYSDYIVGSFGSTKQITGGIGGFIASKESFITNKHEEKNNDNKISMNVMLSSLNQALLLNQLRRIAEILYKKRKVIEFYNKFAEIYGYSEKSNHFRAITFSDINKLTMFLRNRGIGLEIKRTVQPNFSKELKTMKNRNSYNFSSYYSLPLNKTIYLELKKLKLLK